SLLWLSALELGCQLDLVILDCTFVDDMPRPFSGTKRGLKMELAIFVCSSRDRNLARTRNNFAADLIAGLLQIKKGLAEIAIARGNAEDPEAGQVGLGKQK